MKLRYSRAGAFNSVLGYPLYVCERARDLGCMMLTGNEYLDKRLGVGAVLLGHGYPAVDKEAWKAVEVSDMDKESSSAVT